MTDWRCKRWGHKWLQLSGGPWCKRCESYAVPTSHSADTESEQR